MCIFYLKLSKDNISIPNFLSTSHNTSTKCSPNIDTKCLNVDTKCSPHVDTKCGDGKVVGDKCDENKSEMNFHEQYNSTHTDAETQIEDRVASDCGNNIEYGDGNLDSDDLNVCEEKVDSVVNSTDTAPVGFDGYDDSSSDDDILLEELDDFGEWTVSDEAQDMITENSGMSSENNEKHTKQEGDQMSSHSENAKINEYINDDDDLLLVPDAVPTAPLCIDRDITSYHPPSYEKNSTLDEMKISLTDHQTIASAPDDVTDVLPDKLPDRPKVIAFSLKSQSKKFFQFDRRGNLILKQKSRDDTEDVLPIPNTEQKEPTAPNIPLEPERKVYDVLDVVNETSQTKQKWKYHSISEMNKEEYIASKDADKTESNILAEEVHDKTDIWVAPRNPNANLKLPTKASAPPSASHSSMHQGTLLNAYSARSTCHRLPNAQPLPMPEVSDEDLPIAKIRENLPDDTILLPTSFPEKVAPSSQSYKPSNQNNYHQPHPCHIQPPNNLYSYFNPTPHHLPHHIPQPRLYNPQHIPPGSGFNPPPNGSMYFNPQAWNPYPIVPPTGTTSAASFNGSSIANGGSSSRLPDPYSNFNPEGKRFINRVTDMGFSRARVARAVEKLGENDKKVSNAIYIETCFFVNAFFPFDAGNCYNNIYSITRS